MKTFCCFSLVIGLGAFCLAQPIPHNLQKVPINKAGSPAPRTLDLATRSNMLVQAGGMIYSTPAGPSILFLNTQTQVPGELLRTPPTIIQRLFRLPCKVVDKPSNQPIAEAVKSLAGGDFVAVVVVGDAPGYPTLLVAPESRWALLNVAALNAEGASKELLQERCQKELWRAFCYLMGAGNSTTEACLLKPVLSLNDLDAIKAKGVSPEAYGRILVQAKKLGLQQSRMTTYRKAVEEGWAPAPTNDAQRAVWDEIKKAK